MAPLYIASQNGHEESVRALVELGAAVNQANVSCSGVLPATASVWAVYLVLLPSLCVAVGSDSNY